MNSIYIIGDNILCKCYDQAKTDFKCLNFGNPNVQCLWENDIQQIKAVESKYKELFSKEGKPNGVVIMCGGYDLLLNSNPKDVSEKMRKLTQHILSSGVKYVIICSIMDRYEDKIPCEANKLIKVTNRLMAKNYKDNKYVSFINVRPPGKPNDFWDIDRSNLKPESYRHIYDRIKTVIGQVIIPSLNETLNVTVSPSSTVSSSKKNRTGNSGKPATTITLTGDVPIEKRMAEFKDVLLTDYKRICTEEKQLTIQYIEVQKQIEETKQQKNQIATTYEKLFNTQISFT